MASRTNLPRHDYSLAAMHDEYVLALSAATRCAATIILAGMTTTVLAGGEESEAA